jgi:hypothetical protein
MGRPVTIATVTRYCKPNANVDMFADSVVHAVAIPGKFPTLCGIGPRSLTDHPLRPTYRWEFDDWRPGWRERVTCKKCLKQLEPFQKSPQGE